MNRWHPILAAVVMATAPSPSVAQEPPTLDRVEELARLGRAAEARELVAAWWEAAGPRPSRRDLQRGLWLRGSLNPDPEVASLDFRRLVIEFPGGAYSHLALFRLAQVAYAAGDSAAAAEMVAQLGREYPASPVRREAEAWLATAGPVPERVAGTPKNQPEAPPDEVVPAVAGEPPAVAAGGHFAVQLGAFSSQERAQVLLERVSAAGFEARLVLVPGSDLVRVRVGTFDSPEGAGEILGRLQGLGFPATVARDAHREERVR